MPNVELVRGRAHNESVGQPVETVTGTTFLLKVEDTLPISGVVAHRAFEYDTEQKMLDSARSFLGHENVAKVEMFAVEMVHKTETIRRTRRLTAK